MSCDFLKILSNFPAFLSLKKSWRENTGDNNIYIEHFWPEANGFYDEKDENGRQILMPFCPDEEESLMLAKSALLSDQSGWFDDFVHESNLRQDVTEFIRIILQEIEKCS